MNHTPINFSAFKQHYPVTISLRKTLKQGKNYWRRSNRTAKTLSIILLLFVGFFLLIPLFLLLISLLDSSVSPAGSLVTLPFVLLLAGVFLYSCISAGKQALLMEKFCDDNDFTYYPKFDITKEPGILFQKGDSRVASNGISGTASNTGFAIFKYRYSTGSGKNRSTFHFTVAKIRLDKEFPHILLDNKRDGSVGSFEFDRSQRLELEGDFNKYFNVFGPKEYEIEVLQILNPKVMQSLLSLTEPFDIEIYKDSLYIYDKGQRFKEKTLRALFGAIDEVMTSTKRSQETFKMTDSIGDHKPILKRSKWPIIATVLAILAYVAIQVLAEVLS